MSDHEPQGDPEAGQEEGMWEPSGIPIVDNLHFLMIKHVHNPSMLRIILMASLFICGGPIVRDSLASISPLKSLGDKATTIIEFFPGQNSGGSTNSSRVRFCEVAPGGVTATALLNRAGGPEGYFVPSDVGPSIVKQYGSGPVRKGILVCGQMDLGGY